MTLHNNLRHVLLLHLPEEAICLSHIVKTITLNITSKVVIKLSHAYHRYWHNRLCRYVTLSVVLIFGAVTKQLISVDQDKIWCFVDDEEFGDPGSSFIGKLYKFNRNN